MAKNTHTQVTECMIELLGAIKVSLGLTERPFGMQVALLWYSFATVRVMSAKGTDLCSGETTRGDPLLFGYTKIQTFLVKWMQIFTKIGRGKYFLWKSKLFRDALQNLKNFSGKLNFKIRQLALFFKSFLFFYNSKLDNHEWLCP